MPDAVPDPVSVQPVVAPLTSAALFLVGTIEPGGESAVLDVLPDLAAAARSLGFRYPDAGLACVAGFGSSAWDRLFAGPRPAHLHPFRELRGPLHGGHRLPLLRPRADFLDAPPPPPVLTRAGARPEPVPAPVRQEPVTAGADHGSLRIGSLQESAQ